MSLTDFLPGFLHKADPEPITPAPVPLNDPLGAWLFGAQPTFSSILLTPETATQVPAVALAVQTIANAVGGLPVKLYVRNGKGKEADPAHAHEVLKLNGELVASLVDRVRSFEVGAGGHGQFLRRQVT